MDYVNKYVEKPFENQFTKNRNPARGGVLQQE
jgi:hypothetical protein